MLSIPRSDGLMRKKSPYFRTSFSLKMAVRGGLTRCARPAGSLLAGSSSVQLAAPVVEPRSGVLIPPVGWLYVKKKPVLSYELFFEDGGEGGIDSLRSPCGQPPRRLVVCPTGCASCRTPVGCSHPPCRVALCEKKARTFVRALS